MDTKTSGLGKYVTPGEKLGEAENFVPGYGVCQINNILIATLVGRLIEEKKKGLEIKPTLRVSSSKYPEGYPLLPSIGSRVTVRIIRVTPRAASAEILVIDKKPVREVFKGTINQQDVRQTEVDKVEIYKCFAPGDVVLADVLSLGDRHSYFLSTAKNELGVIHAKSKAGVAMKPINWQEMQCPATNATEFRKVARQ